MRGDGCLTRPTWASFISIEPCTNFVRLQIDLAQAVFLLCAEMETDTGQSSAESALKELHAYAKLLYLRNGRQFEDKTSYRELPGNVFTDDSGGDGDSAKNIPFGNVDVDRLRREFLDRLSETASSTKGGRYVVASHMFYWPDKAKVFVAINSGFTEGDALSEFLVNLCTALNVIAAAPGSISMWISLKLVPANTYVARKSDREAHGHTLEYVATPPGFETGCRNPRPAANHEKRPTPPSAKLRSRARQR